ncbi:MAG: radical SAM protein, partial [Caldilineaceae bacterium]|nr:radical SAM protein [Caldilineaceae bacterium]
MRENNLTYHLITLGCPKNKVDSDGIEMLLQQATYQPTAAERDADVLIVNTCGFLEAAKEESIGVLHELGRQKRKNQLLIAAGCLAQRNGDEVLQRVPKVDGLLGTRRWMEVMELIGTLRSGEQQRSRQRYQLLGDPDETFALAVPRPPVLGGSAYLKISDGCNAPCAFCTIPSFKGKLQSRPLDAIVDEAQALVNAGASELVIVAQDTTDYGRDRGAPN